MPAKLSEKPSGSEQKDLGTVSGATKVRRSLCLPIDSDQILIFYPSAGQLFSHQRTTQSFSNQGAR